MKQSAVLAIMMAMWGTSQVAARVIAPPDEIRVKVYCTMGGVDFVPGQVVDAAEDEATRILETAGVRLEWHSGSPAKGESGPHVVAIAFSPRPTALFRTTENYRALAAARPYAAEYGTITVFADRVMDYLDTYPKTMAGRALGYVLAHEIGHVLQGVARHSDSGLMKASWSRDDLRSIQCSRLPIAEEDKQLLRARFLPAAR
jgi:hypothetical protein